MSDKAEAAIEYALLSRVTELAATLGMSIALPNISFDQPDPSPTAKWLRATLLPADAFPLAVGPSGPNQYYGFLQIDVFYGIGSGELAPMRIASEVSTYFKFGTQMSRDGFLVQVLDVPKVRQSIKDEPWIMIPVRVPYRCFADNP